MRLLITSVTALLLLTGCSETKKESDPVAVEEAAGSIEVVKNDNAFKEKVKTHENNDTKNQKYYYDYNNNDSVNHDKTYTKMDANLRVRSPYEEVEIGLLVHKLSKEFIVKCSACHNDYANGIIGPSLLNKDADFIAGTIAKFKTGEKENVLMTALVRQMSDEEILKLANEIAAFNEEIAQLRGRK
jgi:cytochrome c553